MYWPHMLYTLALLVATTVAATLACLVWWRREWAQGAVPFAALMLAAAVWSLAETMELAVDGLAAKALWLKVAYTARVVIPLAWLVLAVQYAGRGGSLTRGGLHLLSALPLATVLLAWSNEAHYLLWRRLDLAGSGASFLLAVVPGPWSWLYLGYSYLLVLGGAVLLIRALVRPLHLYRGRVALLAFGALAPWVVNAAFVAGLGPVVYFDLTPLAWALCGLLLGWGMFHLRLPDVAPIASNPIVESVDEGVIVLDREDRVLDLNPAASKILDVPLRHAVGRPLADLWPGGTLTGETSSEIGATVIGADVTGADVTGATVTGADVIGATVDGVPRFYEVRVSPLDGGFRASRRRHIGRLVVLNDVTAHRQAEDTLRAQKELFESLVSVARATVEQPTLEATLQNSLQVMAALTDAEYGTLFLLEEGRVISSLATLGQAHSPTPRSTAQRAMDGGLAGWVARQRQVAWIEDTSCDARWMPAEGQEYATGSALAVPIVSSEEVLGVLTLTHSQRGHFQDEHRRLLQAAADQIALAVRNAALFQAAVNEHQRLMTLIESSRDGIALVSLDGRVLVVNVAALRALDLPGDAASWTGRSLLDALISIRHRAPEAVRAAVGEIRRLQQNHTSPGEGEVAMGSRAIHWFDLPVQVREMLLGRLLVLHDVTEERLLERMRDDLTHTMVHDLRNPLHALATALYYLQDPRIGELASQQRVMLDYAVGSMKKLLTLVNDILDVSRLENGRMPLQRSAVVLPELIGEMLRSQSLLAEQRAVRLENEVPADLPPAWADAGLVERVLQNLVGNAIKFTPERGAVRVTAGADNGTLVRVSISDTGPGISPDLQERLFQKFVSGGVTGSGSGLGLAFCRLAVEAHGGQIWVESKAGQGATFTFTLPVSQP